MLKIVKSIKSHFETLKLCQEIHDECVCVLDVMMFEALAKYAKAQTDEEKAEWMDLYDKAYDARREMSATSFHNEKRYRKKYYKVA